MEKEEKIIDLDYVFEKEIGQFGRYQLFMMLLLILPVIWTPFMLENVFSASAITHRCFIEGCDTPGQEILTPPWLLHAIPGSEISKFDKCYRYIFKSNATDVHFDKAECPALFFDKSEVVRCEKFVYDRTNSIVFDFDLECRHWNRAFVGSANSIGTLIAQPVAGFISDRFGRKLALVASAFFFGLFGSIRTLSMRYEMYIILQIIQISLSGGAYSSAFVLASESVGAKYRLLVGAIMFTLFALGQVSLGLLAWALPEWRIFNVVIFSCILLVIAIYFILLESVRWLISKKKYDEAKKVLEKISKINQRIINEETYQLLFTHNNGNLSEESLLKQIFKSKVLLKRVCVTSIWFITHTLIFHGLSVNAVNLVFANMYFNFILVALVEIPGIWIAFFLLSRIGRRATLIWAYSICTVGVISLAFVPSGLVALHLTIYLVSKMSIAAVNASAYVYTSELYPTQLRQSLLGFSSMCGRIGAIISPLLPITARYYWSVAPSVVFGVMSTVSLVLLINSPETKDSRLPESIVEAEVVGSRESILSSRSSGVRL